MRWSQYLIPTLKETPQEAQIKSHRLMLRAGLVRKLASGTYSYLPLGLRALQKATAIVREEMNRSGALEVLLPALHPAEIWKETGRYEIMDSRVATRDRPDSRHDLGSSHDPQLTMSRAPGEQDRRVVGRSFTRCNAPETASTPSAP